MAEEVKILEIQVDRKSAENALIQTKQEIEELRKVEKSLKKEIKESGDATGERTKQLIRTQKSIREQRQEERRLTKDLDTENNSLQSLRNSLARLTKERNQTNTSTKEGRERFQQLTRQIKSYTDSIKNAEQAGGDFRRNVGNYKNSILEAAEETDVFGVNLGSVTDSFKSFFNPASAAVAVVGGLVAAYTASARGARDLQRAQDRLGSIFKRFGNNLADLVGADGEMGLFDTALQAIELRILGLSSTIQSNLEVVARERLRTLEVEEQAIERVKKEELDRAEQLRQIRDDERNSFEARRKANEDLLEIINRRESKAIDFQQKRIAALKTALSLDRDNLELQKQVAQAEFELADIREESQSFRSEQQANNLALFREQQENRLEILQLGIEREMMEVDKGTRKELQLRLKLINEQEKLEVESAGENQQLITIARQKAINARLSAERDYLQKLREIRNQELELEVQLFAAKLRQGDKLKEQLDNNLAYRQEKQREEFDALLNKNQKEFEDTQENANKRREIVSDTNAVIVQSYAAAFTAIADLIGENSILQKAAAITQATIDAFLAIQSVLADSNLPLAAKIPASIAIGAQAFANVARISGIDAALAGGGEFITKGPTTLLVGDNPGGKERVTVEPLSGKGQTKVFNSGIALAGGGTVLSDGGIGASNTVANSRDSFNQLRALQGAIMKMPAPIVGVEDFVRVQRRVQVKDRVSSLG